MPAEMPMQAVNHANAFRSHDRRDLDLPVACSESSPFNAPLEPDASLGLLAIVNKRGRFDSAVARHLRMQNSDFESRIPFVIPPGPTHPLPVTLICPAHYFSENYRFATRFPQPLCPAC